MLDKIRTARIEHEPWPHIMISDFVPDTYYQQILQHIPPAEQYTKARYAGTEDEHDLQKSENYNNHGLVYDHLARHPFFSDLDSFFKSREFAKTLLDKFSLGIWQLFHKSPIPRWKYPFFKLTNYFSAVYGLHKDLSGYQISPHPDNSKKIVTWLFYIPRDDTCEEIGMGTYMCIPKKGITSKDLNRNRIGNHDWYDWSLFEIAGESRMVANTFFSFAPNRRTFHGVRLDIPEAFGIQERDVFRGFICAGLSRSNFTQAIEAPDASSQ